MSSRVISRPDDELPPDAEAASKVNEPSTVNLLRGAVGPDSAFLPSQKTAALRPPGLDHQC
jgi:hypothetical protein